ncbi:MAG: cytochrome c-type biosis protein CcmH, partial [Solirubrobacteraceae bacterium]|nr:cytochrome c-type biosis protein CcmH [Solirubrobacteraceae bacterium]
MKRTLAIAVALLAVAPAGSAPAAPAAFNDVETQLMCDTCNVALPIADSPRADQERAEIRRLIAQGKTKQQILDIFAAEYGPNVLAK